jgi:integrase/recombinase XerD
MSDTASLPILPPSLDSYSLKDAKALRNEIIWNNLGVITVRHAIVEWLGTLGPLTAKNYSSGMAQLSSLGFIAAEATLQVFALVNHDGIVDRIKTLAHLSECSKQARAACYISFTRFLNRRTQGVIGKAMPNREGSARTFYKVREKVATEAMGRAQWAAFLQELHKINVRDCLIAKIILQGGKRISEALSLTTSQINVVQREITFTQAKTKGYEKETVITYPQSVIDELMAYIGQRQGIVFVTRSGKGMLLRQLSVTFNQAGIRAGIPFKVTPHVLRASTVTYLKREGFGDSDIMKITGHASSEMVHAYDKSERSQNASKKISLI